MAKNSPKSLLTAVPLHPKTGKVVRSPKGKTVIYGYKAADGTITPLDMEPQRFTKMEARELQTIIKRNKIIHLPDTTFFQKPTRCNEKYSGGEKYKVKVKDPETGDMVVKIKRAKKGEQHWIYKNYKKHHKAKVLKVTFKPPTHRTVKGERKDPIYKKIEMRHSRGKYKQHTSGWRLQERTKLERLDDQILAGVTKLKKTELQDSEGGVKIDSIVMKGRTLNNTLSSIRPPQSFEKLRKQKVDGIGMDVNIRFRDGKKWRSVPITLPAVGLSEYGDLSNILSKTIRRTLLSHGKTFTKLSTFKQIKGDVKAKSKAKGEPYFPEWKRTGVVMSGGKVHDMTTAINKYNRTGKKEYEELKYGDLKIDVEFRYFK